MKTILCCGFRLLADAGEKPRLCCDIFRPHEAFADEDAVASCIAERLRILLREDAALADQRAAAVGEWQQVERLLDVRREAHEPPASRARPPCRDGHALR